MNARVARVRAGLVRLALLVGLLVLTLVVPNVAAALVFAVFGVGVALLLWALAEPVLVVFAVGVGAVACFRVARRRRWRWAT